MTAKEYLSQAYRLDQQIKSDLEEVAALQEMARSVFAPPFGEHVQTSRKKDASFISCLEKIDKMENKIRQEVDALLDLKKEIRLVITTVENTKERMVVKYRYIHNYTWEQIADEMEVDPRTVRRWHETALTHIKLPEKVTNILG